MLLDTIVNSFYSYKQQLVPSYSSRKHHMLGEADSNFIWKDERARTARRYIESCQ